MTPYNTILLAVDFTPDASRIAARARQLAYASEASLHLIHVVEHIPIDAAGEFLGPPQAELHQEMVTTAEERLLEYARAEGLETAQRTVAAGYTKQEILEHAETIAADLIVVGSHGRHGLALLLGSTANAVLHGAPCDVLAVRL
ncbi:universal stress protein [Aquisalimonas asiatica]|uniref:Universal stress protein n=1 Tax=Aquisalimonas asiatica TaxID=406100 RepID=A0A1H8VCY0_9GAMM|nr:universal stress protein [Aquisalimonas asiatica]SEP13296.1 universal stress protein A [Aquisalimonas asiatica]